ncbi:uncharacterized protein [Symphalangus syndactylus]|uniref:uncharacterized protein n=1 Tax=Symphalangus syndactylus TaxID=9590 RepID=UPI0030061A8A
MGCLGNQQAPRAFLLLPLCLYFTQLSNLTQFQEEILPCGHLSEYDVNGILTAKGDLWLSDNRLLKYQALLLEGPVLRLRICATLNPATFLPDNEEKIEHNYRQVIAQTYAAQGDLLEVPLTDPDLNLYTDGSSFVEKGLRKAGYAVVSDNGILESNPLTPGISAQLAELIALTGALELGKGQRNQSCKTTNSSSNGAPDAVHD